MLSTSKGLKFTMFTAFFSEKLLGNNKWHIIAASPQLDYICRTDASLGSWYITVVNCFNSIKGDAVWIDLGNGYPTPGTVLSTEPPVVFCNMSVSEN
jgi:hypothetical protein